MLNNRMMHGTRYGHSMNRGGGGSCGCSGRNAPYASPSPRRNDPAPSPCQNTPACGCEGGVSCDKLLEQIRAVDFALVELVLYLDVYPHCAEALDTYHKLLVRRNGLYRQYETNCGPLTAMGNLSNTSWDWIDKPFPWEFNAN